MAAPQILTISLDPGLADRLAAATKQSGLTASDLVVRALTDHLDGVTAYGRITDEVNAVKNHVATLAGLIGEALAEPPPGAAEAICRYKPGSA